MRLREENFSGLPRIYYSLSLLTFMEKTFTDRQKTARFTKYSPFESFPLCFTLILYVVLRTHALYIFHKVK